MDNLVINSLFIFNSNALKRFFKKISLYFLANLIAVLALLLYIQNKDSELNFKQSQTESALYSTPKNISTDILIMGSSHGRMLTRGICDSIVKSKLGHNIINISKSAAGIIPEYELLRYFYNNNNKCKKILYVIDPFIFYTNKWNEDLYFLTDEPFKFDFLLQILFTDINPDVKYNYIKSKFLSEWNVHHASQLPDVTNCLSKIDTIAVNKRKKALYIDYSSEKFVHYSQKLNKLIKLAERHRNKIVFIVTPNLLGEMKGSNDVADLFRKIEKTNPYIKFYDFSGLIINPELYYDIDHLNAKGIDYFAENYLKPVLVD